MVHVKIGLKDKDVKSHASKLGDAGQGPWLQWAMEMLCQYRLEERVLEAARNTGD